MPTKSYAYAVGNLRAKENSLLKKQDFEQMMALSDEAAAANFLHDKGFGQSDGQRNVSVILSQETGKLWDYIRSVAPDFSVFEALIIPNDYHNLKAVLKGTARAREYRHLLVKPNTVEIGVLEKAVAEKDFSRLPLFMAEAADRAYEALISAGDAQLSDGILDASCMRAQLTLAKQTKIPMLCGVVAPRVFYDNFKIALRAARAHKDAAFLEACLVDTEEVAKKRLLDAALAGTDALLELLERLSRYDSDRAAEAYRESPAEYERFADNYVMSVARRGKSVTVGPEPLIGYLLARQAEIRAAGIVANGIATGADADDIREMLRDLYA